MKIIKKSSLKAKNKKAVAPVIATLLMVAIAVVGGTIVFVFSQGFFSSAQLSGTPTIELIKILGYDSRASDVLQAHDGNDLTSVMGNTDSTKQASERILLYLTNDSVQKIVLGELSFGGYIYEYRNLGGVGLGAWDETDPTAGLTPGNFTIVTGTNPDRILDEPAAELQAGETVTIILDLESDLRIGRSSQVKMITSIGNVFVGTMSIGQQSG